MVTSTINYFECDQDLLWQKARKREVLVSVVFCKESAIIDTLEGQVQCEPGDAIVTGVQGEEWPVTRERFEQLYEAVSPLRMGEDGEYRRLAHEVEAARLIRPCRVSLSGKRGHLSGNAGDWLVRHSDGGLGIVAAGVFEKTYFLV